VVRKTKEIKPARPLHARAASISPAVWVTSWPSNCKFVDFLLEASWIVAEIFILLVVALVVKLMFFSSTARDKFANKTPPGPTTQQKSPKIASTGPSPGQPFNPPPTLTAPQSKGGPPLTGEPTYENREEELPLFSFQACNEFAKTPHLGPGPGQPINPPPTLTAPQSKGGPPLTGDSPYENWEKESLLAALGYKVGKTGETVEKRREILRRSLAIGVAPSMPLHYRGKWGEPNTRNRYRAIIDHLNFLISDRNDNPKMKYSIKDWREDLAWLTQQFGPDLGL
jgi:hypothetical protein